MNIGSISTTERNFGSLNSLNRVHVHIHCIAMFASAQQALSITLNKLEITKRSRNKYYQNHTIIF